MIYPTIVMGLLALWFICRAAFHADNDARLQAIIFGGNALGAFAAMVWQWL